jgi:hypothetical protein
MIEVAFYLGMGQPIVLVVNNCYYPGMTIEGEVITERYELKYARLGKITSSFETRSL